MTDLAARRRSYAARVMALAHVTDSRLEEAFAQVAREDFAGPPPWTFYGEHDRPGDPADPASLYADVLVALDASQGINNGSPSLHALMLQRLGVRPGDHVLHAGIGGGYYTAILARLVGPDGRVTAIEIDAGLAARARANLAPLANVSVLHADAAAPPPAQYDRIYVNFAVARPAEAWLDALPQGGAMVFPLGVPRPASNTRHSDQGAVLRLTRAGGGFAVRFVSHCSFVLAGGPLAGDPVLRAQLHAAFARGGIEFVQSLRRASREGTPPPTRTWFWSSQWSLSYDPPAGV